MLSCTSSDCYGGAARERTENVLYLSFYFSYSEIHYLLPTAAACKFKFKDYVCSTFKALRSLFVSVVHRKKIFVHRAQTALQCCKLLQAHTDQIRPRRNLRENTPPINTSPPQKKISLSFVTAGDKNHLKYQKKEFRRFLLVKERHAPVRGKCNNNPENPSVEGFFKKSPFLLSPQGKC